MFYKYYFLLQTYMHNKEVRELLGKNTYILVNKITPFTSKRKILKNDEVSLIILHLMVKENLYLVITDKKEKWKRNSIH